MQVSIRVSYIVYLSDERKGPNMAKEGQNESPHLQISRILRYLQRRSFFYVVTYVAFLLFNCVIFLHASIVEWDVNDTGTSHKCFAYQCCDVVFIVMQLGSYVYYAVLLVLLTSNQCDKNTFPEREKCFYF